MKKVYRRNAFKLTLVGLVFLLTISAFALKFTVSAGSSLTGSSQKHSSNSDADRQNERAAQIIESPVFKGFDAWLTQFQSGLFRGNDEQLRRGESLAIERAELFKELIKIAPETALRHSVSDEAKNNLPASIAEKIERRVSAYGDFLVIGVDTINSETGHLNGGIEREVVFGSSRYKAFVYGRRAAMTTKVNIPLQGIILNDLMAVDENPAEIIAPTEYSSNNVDAEKTGENDVVAKIGGKLEYFSNRSDFDKFINEQIEWESKIAPVRPDENQAVVSSWTEGPKTVLIIRVDFPDRQGEPVDVNNVPFTQARAINLVNNDSNPFFLLNSYDKTSLQSPTVTPVLRLPQTQAYYSDGGGLGNYAALMNDARIAARTAGYETNNFTFDVIAFSNMSNLSYAGLGYVGAKGLWLNGYFSRGVLNHELGHNYGLNHANLWRTTNGTVIGEGANQEYGDVFDTMGSAPGNGTAHFNARYKRILDWLSDTNIQTVTTNGTYRIFAHDNSTTGGIRALKIRKNDSKNYWIEFRQQFTTNQNAMNGAIIRWDYASDTYRTTQLLDMTPNTSTNAGDAPLVIGRNFYDSENQIRITVIGKGNTTPESLDVKVEFNPFSQRKPFDFDGDGKTDLGIFRPGTGAWWINRSSNNQSIATEFGTSSDIKVPADYTGDGKTDVAFYRPSTGQWFILRSEDFSFYGFPFGTSEDIPSAGDFDGDGKADPAVYRPSTGAWYILLSSGGTSIQQFGIPEDKPVIADYDGDGKDDIAVFRPSSSQWWILKSTGGVYAAQFGATGDKTVQGDYTGDGKADIAFWRPSNGFWYILRSEDSSFYGFPFGINGDMPAPGDYDGDGKFDASVFRPSNTAFYSQMSNGGFLSVVYGLSGDQPIANAFVR